MELFRSDFDYEKRIVKQEYLEYKGKEYFISTVDLGINHNRGFFDVPLYYETMIFPKDDYVDLYCARYPDRETALAEHEKLVNTIKNGNLKLINN